MTLQEFVERTKLENNIQYDTKDLVKAIVEKARSLAKDDYACLTDDEIKEIILKYEGETKEKRNENEKVEVKDDNKKQNEQVALF